MIKTVTDDHAITVIDEQPTKQLKPLGDCVVFRLLDPGTTAAGLHIPDNVDSKKRAQIIAVGPGRMREDGSLEPMPVKVGDKFVVWDHGSMSATDQTGSMLWFCHASQIAALVVDIEPEIIEG